MYGDDKKKQSLIEQYIFTVLLPILFDCGQAVSIDQNVLLCRPLGHTLLWIFTNYIKSFLFNEAFLL